MNWTVEELKDKKGILKAEKVIETKLNEKVVKNIKKKKVNRNKVKEVEKDSEWQMG